jgi:hypothetical protein
MIEEAHRPRKGIGPQPRGGNEAVARVTAEVIGNDVDLPGAEDLSVTTLEHGTLTTLPMPIHDRTHDVRVCCDDDAHAVLPTEIGTSLR